jgi:dolichol kinase
MDPLIHNSLITIVALIYVFSVVGIMDYAVKKGFPQDISRKVVHIAAGSWLVFWPLYNANHWSKYLNITPALVWTILLIIKGLTALPDDKAVLTMTRTGDRKELLRGPLYFTIIMNLMGTYFFYSPIALTSMGLLGWGDGLAPLFGKKLGKHKYNLFVEKSIEGSAAFFIFGLFGAILFNSIFFDAINLPLIIICAVSAAIVEALSPKDIDNLLIPLVCIIVYFTGANYF